MQKTSNWSLRSFLALTSDLGQSTPDAVAYLINEIEKAFSRRLPAGKYNKEELAVMPSLANDTIIVGYLNKIFEVDLNETNKAIDFHFVLVDEKDARAADYKELIMLHRDRTKDIREGKVFEFKMPTTKGQPN